LGLSPIAARDLPAQAVGLLRSKGGFEHIFFSHRLLMNISIRPGLYQLLSAGGIAAAQKSLSALAEDIARDYRHLLLV